MTARNKSFGLQGPAPPTRNTGSNEAEAQDSDLTRISSADRSEATLFDPALADGSLPEAPIQPDPSTLYRPRTAGDAASIREDDLLGAFERVAYETVNPLLGAAAPVLMLLGDLRLLACEPALPPLRQHLANAMREFERKAADSGIAEDDARIARYALCETVDDIVGNLPGADRNAWLQDGMLMRFFRVETAGTGFYEALNAVLADPQRHFDLLEVMHACLSLGFEGQYRTKPGGKDALGRVRRDIYETLHALRPSNSLDISPRWEGLAATLPRERRRIPLWMVAAALPAIVAGAFLAMRAIVSDRAEIVVERLANLNPRDPAVIHRSAVVTKGRPAMVATPPSRPQARADTQLERLRTELATEIADGTLSVATKGDFVVIGVANEVLFDAGAVRVKPAFDKVARSLVAALDKEAGPITIVGHTDSRKPGAASVFKSNYDLSVARATAIRDILIRAIGEPARLHIEGKGDQDPIADNTTAEGRASNRRIEILIRKEQTL